MTILAMLLNGVDERKIMNDIEELARPPPPPPPEPLVEQRSPMLFPSSQPLPTYTVPYSYMQPQHNWAYPGSAYVYPLSAYPFPRGPAGRLLKVIDKAIDKDDKRDLEGSFWWKRVVAIDIGDR
ncbi:uncharacterized protein [Bemisia tabaci]|uniref:uncharacterized protein n=1 Tax=Bemisia tabaci TaxID=7038 RepID=UPI003B283BDE